MKRLYQKKEEFEEDCFSVRGDGDYKMLVDFLISEDRFEKILFPNQKFASSLYKQISHKYFDDLSKDDIRAKIAIRKGLR